MKQEVQQHEQIEVQGKEVHPDNNSSTLTVAYPISGQIGMAIQRIQSGGNHPVQMKQDMMLLQRTIGNRAIVQLLAQIQKQDGANNSSTIHSLAAAGVQGTGSKLPHYDKIQASFGQHDLSHVQAYTGSTAAAASRSIGAEAYASGSKIAFADSAPSVHTAAHEAAHVIQQQSGIQLKGGVGEVGDPYEQHADAVADAVVQGKSAENLLSSYETPPNTQQAENNPVQRKLQIDKSFYNTVDELLKSTQWQNIVNAAKALPSAANWIANYDETKLKEFIKVLVEDKLIHVFKGKIPARAQQFVSYFKFYEGHKSDIDKLSTQDPLPVDYLFLWDSYLEDESVHTVKRNDSKSDRLAKTADFFPRKRRTGVSEERAFNFDNYKAKISGSSNSPGEMEGSGATIEKAPNIIFKTQVNWGKAESNIGTHMEASVLGPDHPLGSVPDNSNSAITGPVNNMYILANEEVKYLAGHMLNEQLGGTGDDPRNLAPIPYEGNSQHKSKVENEVKRLVNQEHKWVHYSIKVHRANMNSQVLKELKGTEEEKIAGDYANKYISGFTATWGPLELDSSNKLVKSGQNNTVELTFPDPLNFQPTAKIKDRKVLKSSFESTSQADFDSAAKAEVNYDDVIFTTINKVRARLGGAWHYERELASNKDRSDEDKKKLNKIFAELAFYLDPDNVLYAVNIGSLPAGLASYDSTKLQKIKEIQTEVTGSIDELKSAVERNKSDNRQSFGGQLDIAELLEKKTGHLERFIKELQSAIFETIEKTIPPEDKGVFADLLNKYSNATLHLDIVDEAQKSRSLFFNKATIYYRDQRDELKGKLEQVQDEKMQLSKEKDILASQLKQTQYEKEQLSYEVDTLKSVNDELEKERSAKKEVENENEALNKKIAELMARLSLAESKGPSSVSNEPKANTKDEIERSEKEQDSPDEEVEADSFGEIAKSSITYNEDEYKYVNRKKWSKYIGKFIQDKTQPNKFTLRVKFKLDPSVETIMINGEKYTILNPNVGAEPGGFKTLELEKISI